MSKKYEALGKEIVDLVGGDQNIEALHHCQTRLRFKLSDESKADTKKIEALDGVLQVVNSGGMYQVVIGMHVTEVYEECVKFISTRDEADKKDGEEKADSGSILDRATSFISSAFAPIVAALAGAGMVKALLAVLVAFHLVDTSGVTYRVINMFSDSTFTFLPILLAYTVAQKLKCNAVMAAVVAGILVHPTWTALLAEEGPLHLFGIIPMYKVGYASSVIPIILILLVQAPLEKKLNQIIPASVRLVFVPMIELLVMGTLGLTILGPIGAMVGNGLSTVFQWLGANAPWAPPLIVGATFPIQVMFGIHHGIAPVGTMSLMQLGFDAIWGPGVVCSNIAQGIAALTDSVVSKDRKSKTVSVSTGITALMGVTEPVLYGVNVPKKYPLIGAMIGGAAGGLFAGLTGTKRFAVGSSGIPAVVMYIGDNTLRYLYQIIIALIITSVVTAVVTAILAKRANAKIVEEVPVPEKAAADQGSAPAEIRDTIVAAPVKGIAIPMTECADQVFASEGLGKGAVVIPDDDVIVSPVSGIVATMFPTGHAVGITSDDGAELLIHIGINTVELDGKHFTSLVQEKDRVTAGQELVRFDRQAVEKEGYSTQTMVIVTNTDEYTDISLVNNGAVESGDQLLRLTV